jgi:hypothetical protein
LFDCGCAGGMLPGGLGLGLVSIVVL